MKKTCLEDTAHLKLWIRKIPNNKYRSHIKKKKKKVNKNRNPARQKLMKNCS